jgi:hypothetical protein
MDKALTNDCNHGEHRKSATPRDGTKIRPLCIHSSWCAGQELVQQCEDDESHDLGQYPGGDGQSLNDKVGDIEVGNCRKACCKQSWDSIGAFDDCLNNRGGCGTDRDDKENLNDLEDEIRVLSEQFDAS